MSGNPGLLCCPCPLSSLRVPHSVWTPDGPICPLSVPLWKLCAGGPGYTPGDHQYALQVLSKRPVLLRCLPPTTVKATSWGLQATCVVNQVTQAKLPFCPECPPQPLFSPPACCTTLAPRDRCPPTQLPSSGFPEPAGACANGFSRVCWKSPAHPPSRKHALQPNAVSLVLGPGSQTLLIFTTSGSGSY